MAAAANRGVHARAAGASGDVQPALCQHQGEQQPAPPFPCCRVLHCFGTGAAKRS